MRFPRASGVLLHPTSLPGRFGIGDLGQSSHEFVAFLQHAGQRWWQILPLGPTGSGNSPYQSHSSFAGNPHLISPEGLVAEGWLPRTELEDPPEFDPERVLYARVGRFKSRLLRRAFASFSLSEPAFLEFEERESAWLEDFALFMAVKQHTKGLPWFEWEPELVRRKASALQRWRGKLDREINYHKFVQFVFEKQWNELRGKCAEAGVKLIGDIPIFVAHDSADVWSRPDLFFLDRVGRPTVVAGVPPDYFSKTGQLWGNPLYRWEVHQREGFAWWMERIGSLLNRVDLIRIDHFRGFEAYWEVPGRARTAVNGRWVPGPGASFFEALQERYPELPLIAEDLGVITPAVDQLRDQFQLPGMRVLQFGFATDSEAQKHLPHRYIPHCVAYTGTHDNDTAVGWLTSQHVASTQSADEIAAERAYALRYVSSRGGDFSWQMIRLVLGSVADTVIVPLQDVLGLDSRARMNIPGKPKGNWEWRFRSSQLSAAVKDTLAELTATYARWNGAIPAAFDPHATPLPPGPRLRRAREQPVRGNSVAGTGSSRPGQSGKKTSAIADR